jgi:hypothetical protein
MRHCRCLTLALGETRSAVVQGHGIGLKPLGLGFRVEGLGFRV